MCHQYEYGTDVFAVSAVWLACCRRPVKRQRTVHTDCTYFSASPAIVNFFMPRSASCMPMCLGFCSLVAFSLTRGQRRPRIRRRACCSTHLDWWVLLKCFAGPHVPSDSRQRQDRTCFM